MTTRQEAIAACLRLPGAYEDYPFDGNWAVMRRRDNGKMFAAVFDRQGRVWLNRNGGSFGGGCTPPSSPPTT